MRTIRIRRVIFTHNYLFKASNANHNPHPKPNLNVALTVTIIKTITLTLTLKLTLKIMQSHVKYIGVYLNDHLDCNEHKLSMSEDVILWILDRVVFSVFLIDVQFERGRFQNDLSLCLRDSSILIE